MKLVKLLVAFVIFAQASFAFAQSADDDTSARTLSVLEEIIVTAQKIEQNQQDVPLAITAFSGEQMRALGVKQSFDIATFTPGVHISGNLAGQNTQFSIRGVTQNDFNDIIEAPNAVYLDEGYLAIAQAQTFTLLDIERVEVLKGPQGTLFGRNATGGLVQYFSRRPDFEQATGFLDVEAGLFDTEKTAYNTTLEAALGGPLSDKFAVRAAVRYTNQDSYLKNNYAEYIANNNIAKSPLGLGSPGDGSGADLAGSENILGRLSLAYEPQDNIRADLSFNIAKMKVPTGPYQSKSTIGVLRPVSDGDGNTSIELVNVINTPAAETRLTILQNADGMDTMNDGGADFIDGDELFRNGFANKMMDPSDANNMIPTPQASRPNAGGDFFGYQDPDGADFTTAGDFAFHNQGDTSTSSVTARVAWDIDESTDFVSVTDFKSYDKLLFIDVDSAPVNQLANYAGVDAKSFTQELRLNGLHGNLQWVTGVFYLDIDTHSDNGLKAPENSIVALLPMSGPTDIGVQANLRTKSLSWFGQIDYAFSEKLSGTIGLRLIDESKDFDIEIGFYGSRSNSLVNQGEALPNIPAEGAPFRNQDSTSDLLWTGKLQLDYRVNDNALIYAGLNRGVKAGSFNAPLLGAYLGSGRDEALPYKAEVLHSVEAGFKLSLGERSRLNGSVFYYDYKDYQTFLFVGVGGVVINADAQTAGVELEFQTTPVEGLDIIANLSYFDATVKDVLFSQGSLQPARDVKPTYAPELQATLLIRYAFPLGGGYMSVQSDASYSDEYFYNLRNFEADKFDAYTLLNAQVSWTDNARAWEFTFGIRNITDERVGIQGFDLATLCGCNEVAYRDPTTYFFNFRRNFTF